MSMYDNMKFPDHEYREYPKAVTLADGKVVIVNDEDEELEVLETEKAPIDQAAEKQRLIDLATLHAVNIDKRWSNERIAQTIAAGGFDASHDPNA